MTRRRWLALLSVLVLLAPCLVASRSRANIEEQRARLPPPATDCSDPVAGTWMSHAYYPHQHQWYVVNLDVRRVSGHTSQLQGQMRVHFWDGDDHRVEPPPSCAGVEFHAEVREPARGTYSTDGQIVFSGTSWTLERQYCGFNIGYALDTYSGKIDPAIMEFQTILDDQHEFRGIPVVFRRVACAPEPAALPHPAVAPPSFHPPGVSGCARGL